MTHILYVCGNGGFSAMCMLTFLRPDEPYQYAREHRLTHFIVESSVSPGFRFYNTLVVDEDGVERYQQNCVEI